MASSSIFIYELRSPAEINVESIYSRLKGYPEDENTYFNLEMISANELLGEYVIVQNAQESYYNPEQRVFEYRIVPKANVISFSITDDFLEIWGNKTSANKLVFELSNLLAPISINSVEVTIDTLLEKLKGYIQFTFVFQSVCRPVRESSRTDLVNSVSKIAFANRKLQVCHQ